ncbi:MAG: TIGR01777 family oxidoreductase [Sandaracinaceae bacterium]
MAQTFVARSPIHAPADQVFAFHERPGAFQRLTPPYEQVEVVRREGSIRDGDRTVLRMKVGPLSQRWIAEHHGYEPGHQFVDVQVKGPFAAWAHTHRVEPAGAERSTMIDEVEYALPLGFLGRAFGGRMVERRLQRMFAYRHEVLAHDARLHAIAGARRLRVAISGASGLIGTSLRALLETGGHEVLPLVRREAGEGEIRWDPAAGELDRAALSGVDAVVHLAGENIAQRWTDDAKARIRESRVKGTALLAEAIASLDAPPKTFVSGSAVGFYGDAGRASVDERSASGEGFLAEVCRAWEEASHPARDVGVRVVNARMGVVLSPAGGALAKMKLPFSLGLGGPVGDGSQMMSWVSIDDAVGALYYMLLEESLEGPVNVTAPVAVDNAAFTDTLGRVLHRPTPFFVPAPAVKLALGEMGQATLLEGQRVLPSRLEAAGYPFAHRTLEPALRHVLGKPA